MPRSPSTDCCRASRNPWHSRNSPPAIASAWATRSSIFRNTTNPSTCPRVLSRRASGLRFTAGATAIIVSSRPSYGRLRVCPSRPKRPAKLQKVTKMFKQKSNNKIRIDTLISAKTRINGDVEFAGGFHLDGYINGNVKCLNAGDDTLSVSEEGCIEGSVIVPNIVLNGVVKGDIEA